MHKNELNAQIYLLNYNKFLGCYSSPLSIDSLSRLELRLELRPVSSAFQGVILGIQAYPLGQIDLSVTFGDHTNFRFEVLTFEVVDFLGSYHAILGGHAMPSS